MRKTYFNNKKGQSIVEFAVLGSIIIAIFGMLLGFMQRLNDSQYTEMEAFRRALEKACTYKGPGVTGAGASVQLTLMQNRLHADTSGNFMKGSAAQAGYSSNVFWAVPKVGSQPKSIFVYRINEDEKIGDYDKMLEAAGISEKSAKKKHTVRIEDSTSSSDTAFREEITQHEDKQGVTSTKESWLKDTVNTNIYYTIRKKDKDDDDDNDEIVAVNGSKEPQLFWNVSQGLFRDARDNGKYKYSSALVAGGVNSNEVKRGRTWSTGF